MQEPYEPEVNDYVIWDRGEYGKDEGWVYFKGDPEEPKKGFKTNPRYITIETGVKPKPQCEYTDKNLYESRLFLINLKLLLMNRFPNLCKTHPNYTKLS